MVDTGDQAVGNRRRGAQDDHEEDRRLVQSEEQDRERKPRIDGMVRKPVIEAPMADRSRRNRTTASPTPTPMTMAMPKPTSARRNVVATARSSI